MNKNQIKLCAFIFIGVLIYFFMPAAQGLTPLGVHLLAVFVPTVLTWLFIGGTGWSALMTVSSIVLLGVYDGTLSFQTFWGTSLVTMVIPFFMLAAVLEESGAIEYLVKWIISRKMVHGHPIRFMLLFIASLILVNAFVHPFVVLVLYFKILKQIASDIGETQESSFYKAFGILIGWVSQFCDGSLIWLRPWIFSMVAIIAGYGFENFTIYQFLKLSVIHTMTCITCNTAIAIIFAVVIFWIRPDLSKLASFDDAKMREELKKTPLTRPAIYALTAMGLVMLCYVLTSFSVLGPIATYLGALPVAAPISMAVAVLSVMSYEGKPILNISKAAKTVPWETVMFLGAIMFYAGIFGKEEYVSSIPFTAVVLVGLAAACFFTNVASNSVSVIVAAAAFMPALLNTPGIDRSMVLAFGALIILLSATAICTPSACGVMGLLYQPEHLKWEGTKKYSISICVALVILGTFVFLPIGRVLLAGAV